MNHECQFLLQKNLPQNPRSILWCSFEHNRILLQCSMLSVYCSLLHCVMYNEQTTSRVELTTCIGCIMQVLY